MEKNRNVVAVVTVPFPMQGHLTPLLRLSRRIAAYEVPVHFVGSDTTLRQATARARFDKDWNPTEIKYVHPYVFPTPPFQNLSPNSNSRYSAHLLPMITATLSGFHKPLSSLVNKLASNYTRVVVIFDALMASVVKSVHSPPNVESYVFESSSAFTIYSAFWEAIGKPRILPEGAYKMLMREIPSMEGCFSPEFEEFVYSQYGVRDFHSGTIFNSCRLIEGLYLDLLANLPRFGPDKIWAVGPLNPVYEYEMSKGLGNTKCLKWLLNQPKGSVLLVSFGLATSLSDEQIEELAFGLEESYVRFVWLLRDADRGDIFADGVRRIELPLGFEERVRDRGMVVREWESQLEILKHCATGGFLTNCGWNSCMESITMGVPIAAWPMHSDQPRNAVLMTKLLKIGVEVRDWAYKDELVYGFKINRAIRKLMASAEGNVMRKRAKQLADWIKQSMMKDGAAQLEMDSFMAHITRYD